MLFRKTSSIRCVEVKTLIQMSLLVIYPACTRVVFFPSRIKILKGFFLLRVTEIRCRVTSNLENIYDKSPENC